MRATQRATAQSRAGTVSLTACMLTQSRMTVRAPMRGSAAPGASSACLLLAMLLACGGVLARPVPMMPEPRSGTVILMPGAEAMAPALERAIRADAAHLWQRDDDGVGLLVRMQAVTWRDGALGCPLPDRMYTQATVPGWLVLVTDGTRHATYHANRNGRWLLCPSDLVQRPLPEGATR